MIRSATEDDIPQIMTLMKSEPEFWEDSWRSNVLDRAIRSDDSLAFVWDEQSQIIGFVCAHDLGFRAYLSELIVQSTARRQGIAKKLVERVQKVLAERGCCILIADVWKDAEAFYRSLGWSSPDVILLRKNLETEFCQPLYGRSLSRKK